MPSSFNDHQWQRLAEAGPQIALGVAASAGSAAQSIAELEAFLSLVDTTADESGAGGILGQLALDTRGKVAAGMLRGDVEVAIANGLQAAREAGAILAVHGDEQEARALRQWLLQVAHTVAGASKEGGVLGFGGEQVSKVERETLDEISDALGASGLAEDTGEGDAPAPGDDPDQDAGPGEKPAPDQQADREVGSDGQPIGADNIREGRVRGVMGGPGQTQGEGQGG